MKLVPFKTNSYTDDTHFTISDKSYDLVSKYEWSVSYARLKNQKSHFRVQRFATKEEQAQGWPKNIFLHRFIFDLRKNNKIVIDHKNGWLDNQLDSLRLTTIKNNTRYSSARKRTINKNLPKGVCMSGSNKNKYKALIKVNGATEHLGVFKTAEEAHESYCKAAIKYFGEFAKI